MTVNVKDKNENEEMTLLETIQQKLSDLQTAVFEPEPLDPSKVTLVTDHQSIDARLNDGRMTADEAKQKNLRKMMHDINML